MGGQSGWVFMVFIFKSASVLVISFLECFASKTSLWTDMLEYFLICRYFAEPGIDRFWNVL